MRSVILALFLKTWHIALSPLKVRTDISSVHTEQTNHVRIQHSSIPEAGELSRTQMI